MPSSTREASESDALIPTKMGRAALLPLDRRYSDIVLLANYITTGLLDSSATVIWGVFASMQTGNSIYIGIGVTDPTSSNRWIKSATSVAFFCFGAFIFSRIHRSLGEDRQRTRVILVTSFTLQWIFIVSSAVVVRLTPKPQPGDQHDLHWHVLLPLALLAMQSAGQTAASRVFELGNLSSTVLTTIYCDLFADARLFAGLTDNRTRNQRLAAPLLLIVGAICGGLWARSDFGLEGSLWTAAVLKGLTVVTWVFWKEEEEHEES